MKQKTSPILPLPLPLYIVGWLVYAVFFGMIISRDPAAPQSNLLIIGLDTLDLGIHELSHMVTIGIGGQTQVIAGSLGQVLFPLTVLAVAIWKKSYFSAIFTSIWVTESLCDVAVYMADARAQSLQLVTYAPGADNVIHDWNYLFTQWGVLPHDTEIASVVRVIATNIGALGLLIGLGLIVLTIVMRTHKPAVAPIDTGQAVAIGRDICKEMGIHEVDGASTNHLQTMYGTLVMTLGASVAPQHIHQAWLKWAALYNPESSLRVSYEALPKYAKDMYESKSRTIQVYAREKLSHITITNEKGRANSEQTEPTQPGGSF